MTSTTITNRTVRTIAQANLYYLTANRNAHAAQIATVVAGITSAHEAINAMWRYSERIAPSFTEGAHDNPCAGAAYLATLGPRQLFVQAMVDECYRLNSFADDAAAVAMWVAGTDVAVAPERLDTFWETDLADNDEPFIG